MISILIIEDEFFTATVLKAMLEDVGNKVTDIAMTVEEAQKSVIDSKPDLVFMDMNLQGDRRGKELAEEFWNTSQIPSIVVTGYPKETLNLDTTSPWLKGFLAKPYSRQNVIDLVKSFEQSIGN